MVFRNRLVGFLVMPLLLLLSCNKNNEPSDKNYLFTLLSGDQNRYHIYE